MTTQILRDDDRTAHLKKIVAAIHVIEAARELVEATAIHERRLMIVNGRLLRLLRDSLKTFDETPV